VCVSRVIIRLSLSIAKQQIHTSILRLFSSLVHHRSIFCKYFFARNFGDM